MVVRQHVDGLCRAGELPNLGHPLAQLIVGIVADRYGRRPVLLATLGLYLLASLACALSFSIETLIAARFVQAVGGSGASVLARAAFEITTNHLLKAGITGEEDHLGGVAENIIVGQPIQLGTGDVKLIAKTIH